LIWWASNIDNLSDLWWQSKEREAIYEKIQSGKYYSPSWGVNVTSPLMASTVI